MAKGGEQPVAAGGVQIPEPLFTPEQQRTMLGIQGLTQLAAGLSAIGERIAGGNPGVVKPLDLSGAVRASGTPLDNMLKLQKVKELIAENERAGQYYGAYSPQAGGVPWTDPDTGQVYTGRGFIDQAPKEMQSLLRSMDPKSGTAFLAQKALADAKKDSYTTVTDESGRPVGQRSSRTGKMEAYPNPDRGRYQMTTTLDNYGNRVPVLIDTQAPGGPAPVQPNMGDHPPVQPNTPPPAGQVPRPIVPRTGRPPQLQRPPTSGEKAVDDNFAKEVYVPWVGKGESADATKNLGQIESAIVALERNPDLTGGTYFKNAPDWAIKQTNEEAHAIKTRVEEVVQRNLRTILGAQFTEEEGKRLIERAYDIGLDAEENKKRLRALAAAMKEAIDIKNASTAWFGKWGTLRAYEAKTGLQKGDITAIFEKKLKESEGASGSGGFKFKGIKR